jgi:hypothetical protein
VCKLLVPRYLRTGIISTLYKLRGLSAITVKNATKREVEETNAHCFEAENLVELEGVCA